MIDNACRNMVSGRHYFLWAIALIKELLKIVADKYS